MHDILPPLYPQKKYQHPHVDKGKWHHSAGGRHFDIVAKKRQEDALLSEGAETLGDMPIAERDVDYRFPATQINRSVFTKPTSQPIMPMYRSVKPVRSRLQGARISIPRMSTRTPGLIVLLVGFAFISFAIWNLQAAGRGTYALATIEMRVRRAIADMTQAGSALADTGNASKIAFASAGLEFAAAEQEMDAALASNKKILEILDVTGTVRSGTTLLQAGQSVGSAGEHVANAVHYFTAENTALSLTDAIRLARPELDSAAQDLQQAADSLMGVSTALLPKELASQVDALKTNIPKVKDILHHLNAESNTLLTLLGADRDRQYLILFANNDELRPVGGFIGSTALVNISKGKVENIDVQSVYNGDGQLKVAIAPPQPLAPIVDRWYLRDSNWFVDYRTDAKKASDFLEKENGPTVDGVILFTPNVIKNLLKGTGPIHVPGYDVDVTAENFVTVTQGEVTYNYDRTINKPKQFLADLTPILLSKVFATSGGDVKPVDQLAALEAITNSLADKDILLYFKNDVAQKEVEQLGWAGTIPQDTKGFLMVNNANIGGHKSDQFMTQEIDTRNMVLASGDVDVVTTIRRTHHGPEEKINYPYPSGEDPSQKDNVIYQRVLVPKGAVLLDAQGFTPESDVPHPEITNSSLPPEVDVDVAAWHQAQHKSINNTIIGLESGYTYFANWLVTKPGQTSVVLYRYRIPHAVAMPDFLHSAASYSVALIKQPGQQRTSVTVSLKFPKDLRIIERAPNSGVTLDSDSSIVYRGDEARDILVGAVVQK